MGQFVGTAAAGPQDLLVLLDWLWRLPDPRCRQGRRHRLAAVLALAACAVLAGAKSLTVIGEWAADAPQELLLCCGAGLREGDRGLCASSEATVRRLLQRLDGDALDVVVGGWLTDRAAALRATGPDEAPPGLLVPEAVGGDGKSLRGAICPEGARVHLISALRGDGVVLAQCEIDARSNEMPAFVPLPAGVDIADAVVTFGAMHTQTATVRFLVEEKHAHYIALVKGNRPALHRQVKNLPWSRIPLMDRTR
ncbi:MULTISPECIES: ISAs1 family transposase [unclassified Streptomyces]|uniref:ISAs1 family transposase n=1 Tax=unclassified Streptomyces TaxID=2593676 RepID=UPI00336A76BF